MKGSTHKTIHWVDELVKYQGLCIERGTTKRRSSPTAQKFNYSRIMGDAHRDDIYRCYFCKQVWPIIKADTNIREGHPEECVTLALLHGYDGVEFNGMVLFMD